MYRVAEAAFQSTARRLSACLAHDEREQLRQCSTITDVFAVLNGACHQLCGSEKGKKVETVAKSIHHYSKCIDIICQSHPEYAALVWGSLRLLLQVGRRRELSLVWSKRVDVPFIDISELLRFVQQLVKNATEDWG